MALYALGDLHLSFQADKPMDGFGPVWKNHEKKIERYVHEIVRPGDTLVLTGDHSWGRKLDQCREDLAFIERLPGRKILLRGNHDMFWDAKKTEKLNEEYKDRLFFLQNNFAVYQDYALVGTKGFTFEGPFYLNRRGQILGWDEARKEQADKLVKREMERLQESFRLAEKEGYTFVHPFNDLDVATGQGSIAMEIVQELPTVDYILVPIGGGGLISGVSTLAKMLNPKIKVIGVEPAEAASMTAAVRAGEVVELDSANTIADGTAVKAVGDLVLPYVQENVDDILLVEDDELIGAFLDMVENHKMIVENSGLLSVAALKQLDCKGRKVVSILSGGNMDVITMSSIVQHGLIQRDRIFSVSVLLPDKPGELVQVAKTIADEQGNVIKLEHNQFVSTNRNAAVELRITMEAFGTEHKNRILDALERKGFRPKMIGAKLY